MKINTELVKSERRKRAWSQEQLAEVSGLGLRTIHRIENTGAASLESIKALSSVFEISAYEIQMSQDQIPVSGKGKNFRQQFRRFRFWAILSSTLGLVILMANNLMSDEVVLPLLAVTITADFIWHRVISTSKSIQE